MGGFRISSGRWGVEVLQVSTPTLLQHGPDRLFVWGV
jgi:hypothetical protein